MHIVAMNNCAFNTTVYKTVFKMFNSGPISQTMSQIFCQKYYKSGLVISTKFFVTIVPSIQYKPNTDLPHAKPILV